MERSRSALVVAATPSLAAQLCAWLKVSGWRVAAAHSYPAAKARLEQGADLLVTELELGDYNGLQLALRAQSHHVPALVVGRHDVVLEREAEQLSALYLHKEELNQHRLLIAVEMKLEAALQSMPEACRHLEFARRPWASLRIGTGSRRMLLH